MLDLPAPARVVGRRDEEIDRHAEFSPAPRPDDRVSTSRVVLEVGAPQTVGDLLVALLVEDRQRHADVEIVRAAVPAALRCPSRDVDEQRRHETPTMHRSSSRSPRMVATVSVADTTSCVSSCA